MQDKQFNPDPVARTSMPLAAMHRALLVGAMLALAAPAFAASPAAGKEAPATKTAVLKKKSTKAKPETQFARADVRAPRATRDGRKAAGAGKEAPPKFGPLADFGNASPPEEVAHVANWVSVTANNKKKAFVLIDKKLARLYVFDPQGRLKSDSPVLLGLGIGDHSVPGVGDKPLSQLKDEEKTTPAGKFLALPGKNTHGDDIIWIDYDAAVSMHRMRKVAESERRAERMATPTPEDNRISNGCVNVPPAFYNAVLKPTVMKHGAFVYVLPETRTPQELFGSYDVTPVASTREHVAQAKAKSTH